MKRTAAIDGAVMRLMAGSANAALFSRDQNMVYDDVLKITWLAGMHDHTDPARAMAIVKSLPFTRRLRMTAAIWAWGHGMHRLSIWLAGARP